MFVDRQKLERDFLDEITKLGNLLDTLKVNYCVVGDWGLLAYNLKSKTINEAFILVEEKSKNEIVKILFKLGYTIYFMSNRIIKVKKFSSKGEILVIIQFIKEHEKNNYLLDIDERKIILPKYIFDKDVSEVKGNLKNIGGKGYFKLASLEVIYFLKMNSKLPEDLADLDLIMGSGRLDIDELIKLFELNGWI